MEEFVARNVRKEELHTERIGKQLDIDMIWCCEGPVRPTATELPLASMATYRLTPEEGNPIVKYADGPNESRDASIKMAIGGLAMGVEMTHMALKRHEAIADQFAALAERGIHEGGTWPGDVEYQSSGGHIPTVATGNCTPSLVTLRDGMC